MTLPDRVEHQFVEFVPDELAEATLYISIPYRMVVHSCLCGCRQRIVTPISPTDWALTYDGRSISLDPSIGNWSLPCRSHYWIRRSRVRWAPDLAPTKIAAGRKSDRQLKQRYFGETHSDESGDLGSDGGYSPTEPRWIRRLLDRLGLARHRS